MAAPTSPTRPQSSGASRDGVDVIVVGAGIIGLATARALQAAGRSVTVIDKESQVGQHQSGHNSGVLHAGLYYRPGSAKARLCAEGRSELEVYCARRGIPAERCGKVVVATSTAQIDALLELRERGRRNGLEIDLLDRRGLAEHEPHADGVAALFVPATGVVDFGAVCRSMRDEHVAGGGQLLLGRSVTHIEEDPGGVHVATSDGQLHATALVNCAGLQADLVARAGGLSPEVAIVPFRGEYHALNEDRSHLVRHLIYPVPDARFPFLGVHLSRGIDGHVHVGPNAVLALAREGYSWGHVDRRDVSSIVRDRRVWRLAGRYWRTGALEMARSWSRSLMVKQVRRLVPDIEAADLTPAGAGVRAQAVAADGTLVDDFSLIETRSSVHVLNAPSPGASVSLALGVWIASRVTQLVEQTG